LEDKGLREGGKGKKGKKRKKEEEKGKREEKNMKKRNFLTSQNQSSPSCVHTKGALLYSQ